MTMTDGWVGVRTSDDPTEVGALAAAPVVSNEPLFGDEITPEQQSSEPEGGKRPNISIGACIAGLLVVGGAFVGWPYVADMLGSEPEPAVATAAPQGPPTQRLVLDGDTMYLEGTVPTEEASLTFEEVAAAVVGSNRVVNNFSISDDAVLDADQPLQLTVADTVQFSTGRADVGDQYATLIDFAVRILDARELVTLQVVGHTDDVGEEATNLNLSMERAEATKDQIVARGIDPERITTEGRGEAEPLESNDTDAGRQANRRVEFLVTGILH